MRTHVQVCVRAVGVSVDAHMDVEAHVQVYTWSSSLRSQQTNGRETT